MGRLNDVPAPWLALMLELNGPFGAGRVPDGIARIRDIDDPCDVFAPDGKPGSGDCETDGHYLCSECTHISQRALRRRQDRCEDCGEQLHFAVACPWCGR